MIGSLIFAITIFLSASAMAAETLPSLPVQTLSETNMTIPDDLPDMAHIFIIGFSRASRLQTKAWVQALESADNKTTVYEIAILDAPGWMQGFVANRIRNATPEARQDHFLLVTRQINIWKQLTAFTEPDIAYVLLMNRQHKVVWQIADSPSDERIRAMDSFLELP